MTQYRKRPVIIEAIQITNEWFDAPHPNPLHPITKDITTDPKNRVICVHTLEGDMLGGIGDWLIRGVKGEYYFCKPDIFAMTYEEVKP